MLLVILFLFIISSLSFNHAATLPSGPLKVTYINGYYQTPQQAIIAASNAGYNVIILGFYHADATTEASVQVWAGLPVATKLNTMNYVHARGGVVLVSLGGSEDTTWLSKNSTSLGIQVANYAIQHYYDGIDIDYETVFNSGDNSFNSARVTFYTKLISSAASILKPSAGPQRIISMAPLAPWFGKIGLPYCNNNYQFGCSWIGPSGGMTAVYLASAPYIDYLFIQFYLQLESYTSQIGLFVNSTVDYSGSWNWFPGTSIKEIISSGVPANKIVIGKIVDTTVGGGYVAPATLRQWIINQQVPVAGAGIWQWKDNSGSVSIGWIQAVYP